MSPPTRLSVQRLTHLGLLLALIVGLDATAFAAAPAPGTAAAVALQDRPPAKVHRHKYVKVSRKVWVPPVKQKVQVGTDAKGRPIYKTQIVRPGYYKTIVEQRCSCGARR